MISQEEANELLELLKEILNPRSFCFPRSNEKQSIELISTDGRRKFVLDVNRCGKIKISKCTLQTRFRTSIILLRLDIDGSEHVNPDGTRLSRNHLHVYREGYNDSFAVEIPEGFVRTDDLIGTLIDFLQYCRVRNYYDLELQQGAGV